MCGWIVEALGDDVPVHFTAFHPDFKMRETPPTPPATLVRARQIAIEEGIRFAYTGNVHDVANQSTWCSGCGKRLIERDWYELGEYNLVGNWCRFCGTTLPGVFDQGRTTPGDWGRKRVPLRIQDDHEYVPLTSSATGEAAGGVRRPDGHDLPSTDQVSNA
jgi:pyruvate formate lyase activating enzyme